MVNLTIDNINVSVPEGTTIMDAAKMADIPIPKLCYLKDIIYWQFWYPDSKTVLSEGYQRDRSLSCLCC